MASAKSKHLQCLSALVRHRILKSTSRAASDHPTPAAPAVELMADLFFGGAAHGPRWSGKPRELLDDQGISGRDRRCRVPSSERSGRSSGSSIPLEEAS